MTEKYRYPRCYQCENQTGHKSGLCLEHRRRKCATRGCKSPPFIAQKGGIYCSPCARKRGVEIYKARVAVK